MPQTCIFLDTEKRELKQVMTKNKRATQKVQTVTTNKQKKKNQYLVWWAQLVCARNGLSRNIRNAHNREGETFSLLSLGRPLKIISWILVWIFMWCEPRLLANLERAMLSQHSTWAWLWLFSDESHWLGREFNIKIQIQLSRPKTWLKSKLIKQNHAKASEGILKFTFVHL